MFEQPEPGHRDWYAFEALRALPRLLLMVDRNPLSATYGCFDRQYWHYRTSDFPCGMSQEFCLPLALACTTPFPGNPYHGSERLRDLVVGAIDFARRASHRDGTCDDYFPYERALGALVFSTYAMTESSLALGLDRPDHQEFFAQRADWLRNHNETGRLSNHQALAALALFNVHLLTGDPRYRVASEGFRDLTLSWQHAEGWFQEYEGADPGYHTCTIDFLAKLYRKSGDEVLLSPLGRAVEFAAHFLHPDGSYGGEYGSRNTYHFYPHGFEVLAEHFPTAARIADSYLLEGLPLRRRYFNDDDRMCAHYVYNWMQAWVDRRERAPVPLDAVRAPFRKYFPGAGLFVVKTEAYHAVCAVNKGGVVKAFTPRGPLLSDTGVLVRTASGKVLVPHLVDPGHVGSVDVDAGTVACRGLLSRRRQPLPTPWRQVMFRLANLTVGALTGGNLLRRLLQKVLITGKKRSGVRFERSIRFENRRILVDDRIVLDDASVGVERILRSSDATSIYVANSNTFQESTLTPWVELSELVPQLNEARELTLPTKVVAVPDA